MIMANLDATPNGVPYGFSENAYATWRSALAELRKSPSFKIGVQRYQFCCGFLQALDESDTLAPHISAFFSQHLHGLWTATLHTLHERQMCKDHE